MADQNNKTMVKTARTTFKILETIKARDEATVTELTDVFSLSKSSIHNYLNTLEHDGYVVKNGNTYQVGLRLLDLGGYARHKELLYQTSKDEVTELAEETGEMTNLLVEQHGRGIYLYRANGENAVKSDSYIGHRVYLHNTALGQAILAHLSSERVNEIIDRYGLPETTENTITERDTLFSRLEHVREKGVAFDDEARLKGLRCVATPIINKDGEVEGAISISGPTSRFQGDLYREKFPEKLKSAANVIELNINYT
ncbi:IclR family transcriptional regulator [Halegenticoccus tardaugens]|uniref:IclR family transcriptional regulator n=1 Tax=Halegenticoccus tardaugens TaxID=2071624 RepID=UPI00100B0BEB|nr:IclR family transcriptional regulator [Halegenticoccus tardaugens]